MDKAWVVELKQSKGVWIPFDIEWTRQDARKTLNDRVATRGGRDKFRIRRWQRIEK